MTDAMTPDPLRIQFLVQRLRTEFPALPESVLLQAVLYVDRDVVAEEPAEAYQDRLREVVRRKESGMLLS